MTSWAPLFLMPNLHVIDAVGVNEAAIVNADDARVRDYCRQFPQFSAFIRKFTDPFGQKKTPGIFLFQSESPEELSHHGSGFKFSRLNCLVSDPAPTCQVDVAWPFILIRNTLTISIFTPGASTTRMVTSSVVRLPLSGWMRSRKIREVQSSPVLSPQELQKH